MTDKIKPLTLHFETSPCGRCGGSGMFGPKSVKGGVCFTCSGNGKLLTRRGKTARNRYDSLLVERLGRRVWELAEGDVVWSHYSAWAGFTPYDSPKAWRTVKSATYTPESGSAQIIKNDDGTEERIPHAEGRVVFVAPEGKAERSVGVASTPEYFETWLFPVYDRAVVEEIMRHVAAKCTGAWLDGEEPPARPVRKPRKPKTEEPVKEEPKPLAANVYPGECRKCGGHVEAKAGERERVDGRWEVQHKDGECQERPAVEEPLTLAEVLGDDVLGRRTLNALRAKGVETVADVRAKGVAWILDWTGVGTKGINRLAERLGLDDPQGPQEPAKETPAEETPQREERPAMANKFGGRCADCDVWVEAGEGVRVNSLGRWITRHKDGECVKDTTVKVTEEGLYRIPGGATPHADVFRVRLSERSGRLYAERFVPHTEEGGGARFVYDPAAVYRLEPAHRMTAEEAADIGRKLHTCMQCGEHLTDPKSIARGIGPVCAKKV